MDFVVEAGDNSGARNQFELAAHPLSYRSCRAATADHRLSSHNSTSTGIRPEQHGGGRANESRIPGDLHIRSVERNS